MFAVLSRPRPKRQCCVTEVETPFGIAAQRVVHGFADIMITYGLRAPHFSPKGFDCWLSAALALALTIEPLRLHCLAISDEQSHTTSALLAAVARLVDAWVRGRQSITRWRSVLHAAYGNVWAMYQGIGFKYGEEHSPATALLQLVSAADLPVSAW